MCENDERCGWNKSLRRIAFLLYSRENLIFNCKMVLLHVFCLQTLSTCIPKCISISCSNKLRLMLLLLILVCSFFSYELHSMQWILIQILNWFEATIHSNDHLYKQIIIVWNIILELKLISLFKFILLGILRINSSMFGCRDFGRFRFVLWHYVNCLLFVWAMDSGQAPFLLIWIQSILLFFKILALNLFIQTKRLNDLLCVGSVYRYSN